MEVRSDAPEAQDEITRRLDKVLARDESDPERVYCASALMFSGSVERFTETIIRKTSVGHIAEDQLSGFLGRRAMQIQTASGRERNFLISTPLSWPESIHAECIADEASLRDLIGDLTHIGGGRRLGHGAIAQLNISDGSNDGWRRRIFSAPAEDRVKLIARCSPPYFRRDARQECFADRQALEHGFV